jgi:hypothetical protein
LPFFRGTCSETEVLEQLSSQGASLFFRKSRNPFFGGTEMKRYCIKSRSGRTEYFDIIREIEDGFIVRLTRISDGSEKIIEESLTKHLFNICLKTGYIYEAASAAQPA